MENKEHQSPTFEIDKSFFKNELLTSIGNNHLDYGCGNGYLTKEMYKSLIIYKGMIDIDKITGYDIDNQTIIQAKEYNPNNIFFTSSKEELEKKSLFSSVTLFFTYHHLNIEADLAEISKLIKPSGIITIVDYNLTNIENISSFKKSFNNAAEIEEIKKIGEEDAFKMHTKTDLNTCIQDTKNAGFETIRSKFLNPDKKYFLWVGQKI